MRWPPRAHFWLRGRDLAEPDLRIDLPAWGEPLYVDVAVVFPLPGAAPGAAAKRKEADKEAAYPVWSAQERLQPVAFSPFVAEAFGRLGPRSAQLVARLAAESAAAWGLHAGVETRRWFALLSRRLQLDQADMLLNSCG